MKIKIELFRPEMIFSALTPSYVHMLLGSMAHISVQLCSSQATGHRYVQCTQFGFWRENSTNLL